MMAYTKRFRRYGLMIFLSLVVAAIVLGIFVHYHSVLGLDIFLSRDLQAEGDTPERKTLIYHFLYAVSVFGKPIIAAALVFSAAIFFWLKRFYREIWFVFLVPLASVINSVVKILVARPRPTDLLVHVLDKETDYSFPSGHVVFYVVFFGYLTAVMLFRKELPKTVRVIISTISISLIILISFSRVYLGVHWVTDTIGGYFLGIFLLSLLLYFYFQPTNRRA